MTPKEPWKFMVWRSSYRDGKPENCTCGHGFTYLIATQGSFQGKGAFRNSSGYHSPMRLWFEGAESAFLPKSKRLNRVKKLKPDPARERMFLFLGRLRSAAVGSDDCSKN